MTGDKLLHAQRGKRVKGIYMLQLKLNWIGLGQDTMVAIKKATVFVSLLIQIILVDFINGGTKKGIESI